MEVRELIDRTGGWLTQPNDHDIVLSSRIRLARNLSDVAFPGWAKPEVREEVWDRLVPVLTGMEAMGDNLAVKMGALDSLDREILFERNFISREQAEQEEGAGLVITSDEFLALMVNEEDHLRIQGIQAGLALDDVFERVMALDEELSGSVPIAFSSKWGYLTACPSNVGTGMRASVMVHVPALVLMDEIGPIMKGLGKIGLAVRGLGGEGSEAVGNIFQISNQVTLGETEEQVVARLQAIVEEVVGHERNARLRLQESRGAALRNHVGRAQGILENAHILPSKEALEWLSGLRLGVEMGMVSAVDTAVLDELTLLIRPGHLQKLAGRILSPAERDEERATLVRQSLQENRITHRNMGNE